MHQGKGDAIGKLFPDRRIHDGITIPQRKGPDAHIEIDVLITIDIPDMRSLAASEILRCDPFYMLTGSFSQRLGAGGGQSLGACIDLIGFPDGGVVVVESDLVCHADRLSSLLTIFS